MNKEETRLISCSSDSTLRVYRILESEEIKLPDPQKLGENIDLNLDNDPFRRVEFFGLLTRKSTDKALLIKFSKDGAFFAIQTSGKQLELFAVRTLEQIKKKQKRRKQREKEKAKKKLEEGKATPSSENEPTDLKGITPDPSDEYGSKQILRTEAKINSFDFIGGEGADTIKDIVISLVNNQIDLYHRKKKSGNQS